MNNEILDVRVIEPRKKHPTIFNRFHALEFGERFVIINDHDPKPLYYQFLGEHPGMPINFLEEEHREAGESMENIRRLSRNFTVPPDGCAAFKMAYKMLEEFETDLHQHIHLENNILFPKGIELERNLQNLTN